MSPRAQVFSALFMVQHLTTNLTGILKIVGLLLRQLTRVRKFCALTTAVAIDSCCPVWLHRLLLLVSTPLMAAAMRP